MLNPLEIDVVEPRTLCPIFSFLQPKAPKTPNVHAVDKVDQPQRDHPALTRDFLRASKRGTPNQRILAIQMQPSDENIAPCELWCA